MLHKALLICLILFQACLTVQASDNPPNQSGETLPVKERSMPRETWTNNFKEALPRYLCKPDLDFLMCYDLNEKDCHGFVTLFNEACLEKMSPKMPDLLSDKDSELFGRMAGVCVHDLYQVFLAKKRFEKEGCSPEQPQPMAKPSKVDPTHPQD